MLKPYCTGCKKLATELEEFIEQLELDGVAPTDDTINDYVRNYEGTYNPHNGHFLCTPCYIKAGMPSSPTGWMAP